MDSSVVCVIKFPEDNVSQCLQHKFTGVSTQGFTAPCLPRVTISKSVKDLVDNVNDSLERVLENCDPSLQQCVQVHLLYAAAATVSTLLPGSQARRSNKSWKLRLESNVTRLRGDLSRLLAGGFPPTGSKKLMHKLRL